MKELIPLLTILVAFSASALFGQTAVPSASPAASPAAVKHKHVKKPQTSAAASPAAATAAASPSPAKHSWFKKKTPVAAASPASTLAPTTPSSTAQTVKAAPAPAASAAPGGGPGKVWVNTETHVYHKEGTKWYGKTKHGKYMTEEEAMKEGDHAEKSQAKAK